MVILVVIVNGRRITHVEMLVVSSHIPPPILKHIRELPPFMFTKRFPVKQGLASNWLKPHSKKGQIGGRTGVLIIRRHDALKISGFLRQSDTLDQAYLSLFEYCADFLVQLFESRQRWFYSFFAGNSLHDFG